MVEFPCLQTVTFKINSHIEYPENNDTECGGGRGPLPRMRLGRTIGRLKKNGTVAATDKDKQSTKECVMKLFPRPDNTACIVVDIQERLMPVLHRAADMEARSLVLLQGLLALEVPLLATEQYPKGLGGTVPAVAALLAGVPVFEKTRFSALIPEVLEALKARGAENVVLAGAEAHICMLQTALDLRAAGFGVYVPYDCTTSRDPANKENALRQMAAAGAVVSNVESVLFQLLGDARHPAFKTVSKLIQ